MSTLVEEVRGVALSRAVIEAVPTSADEVLFVDVDVNTSLLDFSLASDVGADTRVFDEGLLGEGS